MSRDQLLGRDYCFRNSDGYTISFQRVTIAALDASGAVLLVGRGFSNAWVDAATWRKLLATGVLSDC